MRRGIRTHFLQRIVHITIQHKRAYLTGLTLSNFPSVGNLQIDKIGNFQ